MFICRLSISILRRRGRHVSTQHGFTVHGLVRDDVHNFRFRRKLFRTSKFRKSAASVVTDAGLGLVVFVLGFVTVHHRSHDIKIVEKQKQNKNIFNWVSLTMQVTFCSLERRNKKWNGKEIVTNPSNHLTNQKIVVREFFFSFVRSYVRLLSANETSSQIEIAFFTPLWEKNARYQNKNVCETFLLEKCYNFTFIIKVQNVQVTT